MDKAKIIALCLALSSCTISQTELCVPARDEAGRIARSRAAVNEFKHLNPCPSTGKPSGTCPGYIVDHIQPLCACGADSPTNMQWQTVKDAKAKDRIERETCAAL